MALPQYPEKSFMEMLLLILANHRRPNLPFTPQLLMAIFWEETLFNNVRQTTPSGRSGRGVGFGQVEKQEIPKLTTATAVAKGYYVPGVSSSTTSLPDPLSVQIASCMLLHLYEASTSPNVADKVAFALSGYSGNRPATIAQWRDCESRLIALPFTEYQIVNFATSLTVLEDQIMAALQPARDFSPNANVQIATPTGPKTVKFRETLFPRYWFLPGYQQTQLPVFASDPQILRTGSRGPQVSLLQTLLNGVVASSIPLKTDGIFGPKTHSAVQSFQRMAGLVVDGAVGPKTRRSLVG